MGNSENTELFLGCLLCFLVACSIKRKMRMAKYADMVTPADRRRVAKLEAESRSYKTEVRKLTKRLKKEKDPKEIEKIEKELADIKKEMTKISRDAEKLSSIYLTDKEKDEIRDRVDGIAQESVRESFFAYICGE